jgi:ABC-type transporter Mla subunit MlaD
MQLIVDFTLLAASLAASLYCFVLHRRLNRLGDMRAGIGASIASMSNALEQTQAALAAARAEGLDGIERLSALVAETQRIAPELESVLDALEAVASEAVRDIDRARHGSIVELRRQVDALVGGDFAYLDDDTPPARARGGR